MFFCLDKNKCIFKKCKNKYALRKKYNERIFQCLSLTHSLKIQMINRIRNNRSLAPFILNIELTDYCPLHCKQCYKKLESTYLEWNRLVALINEARDIGVKKILLSGGEPLCYPFVFEAIQMIKQYGMYAFMSSSGSNMDAQTIQKLKESKIDIIYLSLNGSTKQINELSRDGYDTVMNAMSVFKTASISFRVNWVARADNLLDFPRLIELCKEKGAEGIDVLSNKPNVNGVMDSPLDRQQLHELYSMCQENDPYVQIQSCFYQLKELFPTYRKTFFEGCLAGKASMAVFADGTFSICPHIYGNKTWGSIMEFWESCKNIKNDGYCKLQKR